MKSLHPATAEPSSDVDSNWQTSLLQPLRNMTSGGVAAECDPAGTYGTVGRVTSTCSGVPSNVRTLPVHTMKACPPGGVVGLPAVGAKAVPFSVGQEGAWACTGECENTPSAAATSAPPASTRAARADEVMFEKRCSRPSSCAAGARFPISSITVTTSS